jgi:hypothetical protein
VVLVVALLLLTPVVEVWCCSIIVVTRNGDLLPIVGEGCRASVV